MAKRLSGKEVADTLTASLQERTAVLQSKGITPTLAIVRLGERPEDMAYERGAMNRSAKVGVTPRQYLLPADATQGDVLAVIQEINQDDSIHGCLLFRPLPKHIDESAVCKALSPVKDVDGITDGSMVGLFTGTNTGFPPCTAQACMETLRHYGYDVTGKRVVVIGRSLVIGKPVAMLLLQSNATVTICHTKSENMAELCRSADILVVAAGKAGVVDESFVSPNQIVLDVGINMDENGKLVGDVKFDAVEPIVAAITPVPAGIGSVTSTVLCSHVVAVAEGMA